MIFGFLIKIFKHELITGRIFSFICSLLVSILIYAILYKKTKDILISILTSLIYFSFGLINYWSTITRMDIFSVLLSLIGIYLITNYNNKKKFYTSILFFILAIYSNQSLIAAPAASFLWIYFKNRKKAIRFLILFSSFLAISFLLLNIITKGQIFLHTIYYNFSPSTFQFEEFKYILINMGALIVIGFFYILKYPKELFSHYFILSSIIATIKFIKSGSDLNYFIEPTIALVIVLGITIHKIYKHKKKAFLFLTILLILLLPTSNLERQERLGTCSIEYEGISNFIKTSPGNVLVEYQHMALKNKKELNPDAFKWYELESKGIINESEIYDYCLDKNYSLIIYFEDYKKIKGLKKCIDEKYTLIKKIKSEINYGAEWKIYKSKEIIKKINDTSS